MDGGLTVDAGGGDDEIVLSASGLEEWRQNSSFPNNVLIRGGDSIQISTIAWAGVEVRVEAGDDMIMAAAADSSQISINGGADHDNVTLTGTGNSYVDAFGNVGNDTITLTATGTAGARIYGGTDTDSYYVQLGQLAGPVEVYHDEPNGFNAAETDTLVFSGTAGDDVIFKSSTVVTHGNGSEEIPFREMVQGVVTLGDPVVETVSFEGLLTVTVDGGEGNDLITDPGEQTTILGGPGDDTITINATMGDGVWVDGGEGADTYLIVGGALDGPVVLNDSGADGNDQVTVTGTSEDDVLVLTQDGILLNGTLISFVAGLELITLDGGGGNEQFVLQDFPTVPFQVLGDDPLDRLTVTSTADTIDLGDGVITLREALQYANARLNAGQPDAIQFAIPTNDDGYDPVSGTFTIRPLTPLPPIIEAVDLDGDGVIELDGSVAGAGATGLEVRAGDGTIVRGLTINRFFTGISLRGPSSATVVQENRIGTDTSGTNARPNTIGVALLLDTDGNQIADNLISGNSYGGIVVGAQSTVSADFHVTNTLITGNLIGTEVTGSAPLGNGIGLSAHKIRIYGRSTNNYCWTTWMPTACSTAITRQLRFRLPEYLTRTAWMNCSQGMTRWTYSWLAKRSVRCWKNWQLPA